MPSNFELKDLKLIESWQRNPLKFYDEALLLSLRRDSPVGGPIELTPDQKGAFEELAKLVNAKMRAGSKAIISGKNWTSHSCNKY